MEVELRRAVVVGSPKVSLTCSRYLAIGQGTIGDVTDSVDSPELFFVPAFEISFLDAVDC
jgi:hypothetical protein